jgi:hypothetical protein
MRRLCALALDALMDALAPVFVPRLLRGGICVPGEKTSKARVPRPLTPRLEVLLEDTPAARGHRTPWLS